VEVWFVLHIFWVVSIYKGNEKASFNLTQSDNFIHKESQVSCIRDEDDNRTAAYNFMTEF
jgi:hypothetical protein